MMNLANNQHTPPVHVEELQNWECARKCETQPLTTHLSLHERLDGDHSMQRSCVNSNWGQVPTRLQHNGITSGGGNWKARPRNLFPGLLELPEHPIAGWQLGMTVTPRSFAKKPGKKGDDCHTMRKTALHIQHEFACCNEQQSSPPQSAHN